MDMSRLTALPRLSANFSTEPRMNKIFRVTPDPFDCRLGQVWVHDADLRRSDRLHELIMISVFEVKS
jgi:hypothetical protein